MVNLLGRDWTRDELERALPDLQQIAGIRHYAVEDGPGRGARVLQIDSGGGLRIDVLPDRSCDIGAAWHRGTPFAWINPMDMPTPAAARNNTPLSGLMTTCGFDHVRQATTDEGRSYPQHGSAMHVPARILSAAPRWRGDDCELVIEAEVAQIRFDRGGVRLSRCITVPVGGQSVRVSDRVAVTSGAMPVMALYHINLGFPLINDDSVLTLDGDDVSGALTGPIQIRPGVREAKITAGRDAGAPCFGVRYSTGTLGFLQTFGNRGEGVNVFCLEPVTHDRLPRSTLRDRDDLTTLVRGDQVDFELEMHFQG